MSTVSTRITIEPRSERFQRTSSLHTPERSYNLRCAARFPYPKTPVASSEFKAATSAT